MSTEPKKLFSLRERPPTPFSYNGGHTAYVGVMAQEVRTVAPDAVTRGPDGYMRVSYDRLGLPFETYDQWLASGAHLPSVKPAAH